MDEKKELIIVSIIALASRVFLSIFPKMMMWDDAIYMLNAKWLAGQKIFWEALRPPVLPFIFSLFMRLGITSELFFRILTTIFSATAVLLTYYITKKIFGKKVAIFSSAMVIVSPLSMYWSPLIYTEILTSVFLLATVYFSWKGMEEDKYLYLAALFGAISFLTKYTAALAVLGIVIFLLLNKKLNLKKIAIVGAIGILVISPWLAYNYLEFGNPLLSFEEAVKWKGKTPSPVLTYFNALPEIFSIAVIPFLYGIFYTTFYIKKKEIQLLAYPIVAFLAFIMLDPHKEVRYILPIVPLMAIYASYFAREINWKKWGKWILIFFLAAFIISAQNTIPKYKWINEIDGFKETAEYINGKSASVDWPLTAYYSGYTSTHLSLKKDYLKDYLYKNDIKYVVVSSKAWWADSYASNFSFFDSQDYLKRIAEVNDSYQTYRVYKVGERTRTFQQYGLSY